MAAAVEFAGAIVKLGGSMLGHGAAKGIQEFAMAMARGATARALRTTTLTNPT